MQLALFNSLVLRDASRFGGADREEEEATSIELTKTNHALYKHLKHALIFLTSMINERHCINEFSIHHSVKSSTFPHY
jgi:hypothetical protein